MENTIDVLTLLDWPLQLGEQRHRPADCVGRTNNSYPDMFAACRVRLAVRPKCGKSGSGVNAPLLVAEQ